MKKSKSNYGKHIVNKSENNIKGCKTPFWFFKTQLEYKNYL